MRFNEKCLIALSQKDGEMTGRLSYTQYKGPLGSQRDAVAAAGFRDRFFKLIGNLLFYFRFNEFGAVDYKEPVGVLVLENYSVQPEYDVDLSFAFGIIFLDEPDKRHIFTARTDTDVQLWINKLQTASYQHWNNQLVLMRTRLQTMKESRLQSVSEADFQQSESVSIRSSSPSPSEALLVSLEESGSSSPAVPPRPAVKLPGPPPVPTRPNTTTQPPPRDSDLIKF